MPRLPLPPLSRLVEHREVHFLAVPEKRNRLVVTAVGREHCRADYLVERDSFQGFGLEFVLKGSGTVTLDGVTRPISAGSLYCYGPATSHTIRSDKEAPMTKYFVDFQASEKWLDQGGLRAGMAWDMNDLEGIRALFELMLHDAGLSSMQAPELVAAYLQALLLKLAAGERLPGNGDSKTRETFIRCRSYLEANHRTLRSLAELAEGVGVQGPYLCRLFAEHAGIPPYRYLVSRKLETAARELAATRDPIKQIAARIGFEDPFHFSRLFKRHFGVSPAAFRDSPRNEP